MIDSVRSVVEDLGDDLAVSSACTGHSLVGISVPGGKSLFTLSFFTIICVFIKKEQTLVCVLSFTSVNWVFQNKISSS